MTNREKSKFALVVFDARTQLDQESIGALERLLRNSERFALGFAVRVRCAALSETAEGAVCAIALAGLPAGIDDNMVAERLEMALTRLAERDSKLDKGRNVALAAIGENPRVINDGAAAVKHLLDQVGAGPEPFGKILRLFTPPGIDSGSDPIARRNAAARLRMKLNSRIQDMLADAGTETKSVGFVEAQGSEQEGLIAALDNMLQSMDPVDPAVADISAEIKAAHNSVNPTLMAFLNAYRNLGARIDGLCRELKREDDEMSRKYATKFAGYSEAITRTSSMLEKLLR